MDEDFDMSGEMGDMGEMGDFGGEDDSAAYAPQKEGEEKDLASDGGLKKLLLKAGEGWDKPETGDEVSVHYTGTLLDGTKFDSSVDRGTPFTFKLGQGQVIKGWDKGVASMKKGEKCIFTIAPEYAYGERGSPPTIPANATLKFEVELLSWISVKDICGDGGVLKKVVEEGKKWEMPKDPDQVTVKYEAKLSNGTVFAKSPEEGIEFYVKDGHLCPAIAKAVKTMYKGQKVLLTVKPQYGFGDTGKVEGENIIAAVPGKESLSINLELVSWKSVERVTDDMKVMKKVIVAGDGYEKPNEESTVRVKYIARLLDGKVVEKKGQEEGKEFEFITDEEQVIPGLDRAVMKMKKGEKAEVTVAAEYAYGDKEIALEDGIVPSNSTLVYDVELVSFEKDKESWELSEEEKVQHATVKKEKGNALYKEGKYARASKKYSKAVKLVEIDSTLKDELKKTAKALQVSCNLNDAACKLKLKDFVGAAKLTSKVLEVESSNVKALFRRAQAYMGTKDYDLAEWDVKRALELDPNNREIKAEYKVLKQKVIEQNKKEAKLYGNMFARLSKMEEKEASLSNGHATVKSTEGEAMDAEASPVAAEQ